MSKLQTPADPVPRLVDVDALILRLTMLSRQHEERGKISHALGVRSAIESTKRMLAEQRQAARRSDVT